MTNDNSYEFSYQVDAASHDFWESPTESSLTVPLGIFAHASTMQALARYLVDAEGLSFTTAANILHRSVKSTWASYHQTDELPPIDHDTLRVPVSIFSKGLPPLEALVRHLRKQRFRNIDVARALDLSPKTTSTAYRRSEVRQ